MADPLRLAVVTPRYSVAGVPLAQWRFAAALAARGHRVDLIIGWCDPDLVVPSAPGVTVTVLGRERTRGMAVPIWRYLRRERPDAVFSAEDHLNTFVLAAALLARSRARVSGSSRVTPFDTYSNTRFTKRWLLKKLAALVAPRADALTCVSEDMVAQYRQVFPDARHVCVYNIVAAEDAAARIAEPVEDRWWPDGPDPVVVAAGTLAPWKGFADLIRAVQLLEQDGVSVRLVILGEGGERGTLEALAAELGGRVILPGRVANPLKYFARADVFALSSRVEGMPNVLVEAMMSGCTPVATDCPTGPRELLQGGRYGYLVRVGDARDIADGIARAIARPIPPERLGEAVLPFTAQRVIDRHFELLGLETD